MNRRELMSQIQFAAATVTEWPAWKRGVLEDISTATVPVSRDVVAACKRMIEAAADRSEAIRQQGERSMKRMPGGTELRWEQTVSATTSK